ncbi:MAG: hypothetical protein HGA93_01740 [Methanothrix sp.]|nr:hypothetical protein [Methanothrix sp.]
MFDNFIISAVRLPINMSPETRPFRNSNLFSNHFLEKLVQEIASEKAMMAC